MAGEHHVG